MKYRTYIYTADDNDLSCYIALKLLFINVFSQKQLWNSTRLCFDEYRLNICNILCENDDQME